MQTAIAYLIAAKRCEIDEFQKLNRICGLVRVVSELVQHLQSERGVSNLYLTSEGLDFHTHWKNCIEVTDVSREKVLAWLDAIDPATDITGGSHLLTRIAVFLHALDQLPSVRSGVMQGNVPVAQSTERYTHLISTLLALVFDAADIAVDPEVSRLLIALFNLMQGKEFVGQERALGARLFSRGYLAKDDLKMLSDFIERQEQCFERFESFCGDALLAQWHALLSTMPITDIERMRRKLFSQNIQADKELATVWFSGCSKRIDDIYMVEQHLTALLQKTCLLLIEHNELGLLDQQALLAKLAKQELIASRTVLVSGLEHDLRGELRGVESLGSPLARDIFDVLQKQTRYLQSVREELTTVKATLEERKLIERAKGVLMSNQSLTEDAAYRVLRDKAMNQNRRLVDIAESVLSIADLLPKS